MRRNIVFDNRITPPVNEMWCMCGYGSSMLRSAVFSLLAQSYHNGPLKENSGDDSQPAVAQLDVSSVLSVAVGAERGPQLSNPLA